MADDFRSKAGYHPGNMARNKPPGRRAYVKEWRERLDMSLEEVGENMRPPHEKGVVQKWETLAGNSELNPNRADEIGAAMRLAPGQIFKKPPPQGEPPTFIDLNWLAEPIPAARIPALLGVIEAMGGRKPK